MAESQKYRFIFRTSGGAFADVRHPCRPGDAENCARRMARIVAKKLGEGEVTCIWMKPEGTKLPPQMKREVFGA